jgi:hypothetical protein
MFWFPRGGSSGSLWTRDSNTLATWVDGTVPLLYDPIHGMHADFQNTAGSTGSNRFGVPGLISLWGSTRASGLVVYNADNLAATNSALLSTVVAPIDMRVRSESGGTFEVLLKIGGADTAFYAIGIGSGVWNAVAWSWISGIGMVMSRNGAAVSLTANPSTSGEIGTIGGDLSGRIGATFAGANGYDGKIALIAMWPDASFDQQALNVLSADPYQVLRAPKISPRFLSLVHSVSGPAITSIGTKLEAGQALVINGGGFGTETGDAAVTISPANDIADAGAVVQTPTAWADGQITVASPTLTGMSDGDTVYVFVTDSAGTDSAGQSVQIADMVLRVGPPVATDDILDTDTGDPIASESLVKVAVMTTDLETVVAAYTDATITAGKFEYDDSSVANITTEDDEFVVVMNGGTSRLGALRATVVDRNED